MPRRTRAIFTSHQELVAEQLAQEAIRSGATPISALEPRELDSAQGTVAMLTLNPRSAGAWLEADLRLVFSANRTDDDDGYALCLSTLLSVLPQADKDYHYRHRREPAAA